MIILLFVLLVILTVTSNLKWIRVMSGSLAAGWISASVSTLVLVLGCDSKILEYSYCGELSGLLNVMITSGFVGTVCAMLTGYILYRRLK